MEKEEFSLDLNELDKYLKWIGIKSGIKVYGENISRITEVGFKNIFSVNFCEEGINKPFILEAMCYVDFVNSKYFSFDIMLLGSDKASVDMLKVATNSLSLASENHKIDMILISEARTAKTSHKLMNLATDPLSIKDINHYHDMVKIYSSDEKCCVKRYK